MSLASFESYLSTVPPDVDIHFSGFSEPWHAPDCGQMVLAAAERGHRVAMFTTADGMSVEDVTLLTPVAFKRFVVHLPDASGEMRLRLNDTYIDLLEALASGAIRHVEFMTLGIPHPEIRQRLGHTPSSRRVHSRAGNVDPAGSSVGVLMSANQIETRSQRTSLVCRADRMFSNVLLPNGDVQLCCMDYGLEHVLGNLAVEPYKQIVGGQRFADIFDALRVPDSEILCRRCEYAIPGRYVRAGA